MTDQITVSVDPDVAQAYRSVSDMDRRKLDLLVNLRLRDATQDRQSLREIMRDISRDAQRRGLTPETLQTILDGRRGEMSSTPMSSSARCCSTPRRRDGLSPKRSTEA